MTQKYYIKDPTPIINYILDQCPTISVHRLQVLLFSFCKVYSRSSIFIHITKEDYL